MKFSALRRRMRKDATRGSAAIEFAFIAPIFFLMLFAIIETGIVYFSQFTLQNAVTAASRQIRTGQPAAQTTGTAYASAAKCTGSSVPGAYTSAQQWFSDQICCGISGLLTCSNLHVNVSAASGFGGTSFSNNQVGGYYVAATDAYNPGGACSVVLVRATYTWTVFTPALTWFLVNMVGNGHLLAGTTAFRNEPYGSTTC